MPLEVLLNYFHFFSGEVTPVAQLREICNTDIHNCTLFMEHFLFGYNKTFTAQKISYFIFVLHRRI